MQDKVFFYSIWGEEREKVKNREKKLFSRIFTFSSHFSESLNLIRRNLWKLIRNQNHTLYWLCKENLMLKNWRLLYTHDFHARQDDHFTPRVQSMSGNQGKRCVKKGWSFFQLNTYIVYLTSRYHSFSIEACITQGKNMTILGLPVGVQNL